MCVDNFKNIVAILINNKNDNKVTSFSDNEKLI